jgi:hypothetical protein
LCSTSKNAVREIIEFIKGKGKALQKARWDGETGKKNCLSVSRYFKPLITRGWGMGRARVMDSYSAHALKLALRYFNHIHEV